MTALRELLPESFKHPHLSIKVVPILPEVHEKELQVLETDPSNPLQWFNNLTVERILRPHDDSAKYTILAEGNVVGFFCLETPAIDLLGVGMNMSFCLVEAYRGRGVTSLVLFAVLNDLFGRSTINGQEMKQVLATVDVDNKHSIRFHERIGIQENKLGGSHRFFVFSKENWNVLAPRLDEDGRGRF